MPLLRALGLSRTIDGRTLWRALDLELEDGEQVALVGPSGSGKSLLLRTLVALEPADKGRVSWWDESLGDADLRRLRRRVVYLHQEPAFGEGTVEDALDAVASFGVHSLDDEERREHVRELFRRLDPDGGRGDLLRRQTGDLSGGERRMVALVRALQLAPEVLLLDEPVAGLDRELAERVRDVLSDHTWIWVAHHGDQVEADRVVRLESPDDDESEEEDEG